ncbi:MAG: hypothetical protein PHO62_08065 [Sulfurimonas sp.]|uniref:hypothetical protein n=1 Tax=Sulfurimonas sp. TaxID=2022749 RepID=UPI0026064376|nr:hypothetical protein [Sulfurimonas sp.]MDD5373363.1 hypothetical protein [Sulfurimonas sp.]
MKPYYSLKTLSIISIAFLSSLLSADINATRTTQPSAPPQVPSFDYRNMTTNQILNLPADQLSTINETAFAQIFGNTNISQAASSAINTQVTQAAEQVGNLLNNVQTQATELTQNITQGLENLSNMNLSNLSAANLNSLSNLSTQSISSISGGNSSKEKITTLISLQANINQKLAAQTIAKARLLILYREDLLLHKKINFTQSKIVQMEKLK